MIELTNELKNTARYSPVAIAEDGKRFVFLCDAFYSSYEIGVYDKTEVYKAKAFCPDDTPDEDGDLTTYDIYFEVINWGVRMRQIGATGNQSMITAREMII